MSCIIYHLTFVYVSFAKIFCQRKSRKIVSVEADFSFRTAVIGYRGCTIKDKKQKGHEH